MIKRLFIAIAALLCGVPVALADFNFTAGSGLIATSFTASTGGTSLCAAANTHCFSRVNINSAGTEIFTVANPGTVTAVGLAQGSTTSGQTGSLILGAVTTAAPSYTTAQTSPISLDLSGNARIVLPAETTKVIGTIRNVGNVGGVFDAVSGAAVPANLLYYGVNVGGNITPVVGDPCQTNAHSYQPISQTTSTQLFAGTSAKKTYVCHVFVLANAAETVTLVSGTGTVCATSPHAMIGPASVTALGAVSANGGFSLGNGGYAIAASTTNADNVCLVQVGAVQLTGVISYVAQ